MSDLELLSFLIGDIYDAALDHGLWPSVLEKTTSFVKSQTATLTATHGTETHFYFQWGHEPRFLDTFHSTYAVINPLNVPVAVYSKVGEIQSIGDLIPHDEFLASRFYREWAAPQGLGEAMWGLFEKTANSHAGLSVIRRAVDGPVDAEARRRFSLLYPHFRRAVAIGKIIDLHKFEAAAFADSLDGLSAAMFLVDADGRLAHVNAAGRGMIEKGDVIRTAGGKLAAADPQADIVLRDIFINAADGDRAVSTKGVEVPLTARGGERYVAHVLPLTSGVRRRAGATYSAVAAVFVRKAELELPHPLETIASVFKLTSAEMRVLMTIVQLGGIREVASVLGIGEPTVKTHLQHVYEKTGVSRQADLVKLVAGYMSPLQTAAPQ
jgi:DNA-binding CsgD family transcriptional regulator